MSLSLEDIPELVGDFLGINETTAALILSIIVILALLIPTMILARGENAVTVWLIMVFFGQLIVLGLGWLPFWVLIMTIAVTALSIALIGSNAIGG